MSNAVTIRERDQEIAQEVLAGSAYAEVAKNHNLSKRTIYRILEKPEIKDVVDTGLNLMVHQIPLAVDVFNDTLTCDDKGLRYKAAQDVLKMASILPSNVTNQTINNIYNQQNNIITPDTMELVKAILPGMAGGKERDD